MQLFPELMSKSFSLFNILLIVSLMCFVVPSSNAQDLEVGLFGGAAYYLGDINPGKQFNEAQPAFGLIVRYNASTRWAFRFSATTAEVTAQDAIVKFNETRGLAFKTRINDFAAIAEFNFFNYFTGSKRDYVTPYIFGGISIFQFSPKALDGTDLQSIGTEGQYTQDLISGERVGPEPYNKMSFSIPFGVGVKYSLGKRVGLAIEWRMQKAFTDYIDDVSTKYADVSPDKQPYADPSGKFDADMQRGDKETNDWYSFAGITLTYKFNLIGKQKCENFNSKNHW